MRGPSAGKIPHLTWGFTLTGAHRLSVTSIFAVLLKLVVQIASVFSVNTCAVELHRQQQLSKMKHLEN